jgi:hypothetical protein
LVSELEIENKLQLRVIEQLVIDKTDCVNQNRAHQTIEQLKEQQTECKRRYYALNKELVIRRSRQNQITHSIHRKGYLTQYYEVKKDRINQQTNCGCGSKPSRTGTPRHQRTQKHQRWLAQQNNA